MHSNGDGKNLFVTSVINVDLWNQAAWRAVVAGADPSGEHPPILGLLFENRSAGEKIFKEWRERFGSKDDYEEIRVAIIEGEIPGEDSGYTVHINTNIDGVLKRTADAGQHFEKDLILTISRYNRMHPEPNSPNLPMFKSAYAAHKEYILAPVVIENQQIELLEEYGITKNEVHFLNAADISENDIDSVIFGSSR